MLKKLNEHFGGTVYLPHERGYAACVGFDKSDGTVAVQKGDRLLWLRMQPENAVLKMQVDFGIALMRYLRGACFIPSV